MKKKLLAVSSLLVGAVTLFASVGCATKDIGKITPVKTTKSFNVETLNIDSSENTSVSVDRNGMAIITTKNYNKKGTELESYTYSLFNLKTNTTVHTEEFDVYEIGDDEKYSPIMQRTSGFYYSTIEYYDNLQVESTEYTLYDKSGTAFTELEGNFEGNVFVDNSYNRYYLNVDGKIVKESNPLAIICASAEKVGDYYVSNGFIFDGDGKLVRSANSIQAEMEIPVTASGGAEWIVDNYFFVQYRQLLPESEKNYDFLMREDDVAQKYDLVTKRYDIKKGKVKEIDLDFLVERQENAYNDESIILRGYKIVDKQVVENSIVQSFDKNGDVLTDLQKLVPGASDVNYVSESALVLDDMSGTHHVIQKSKVVATFPSEVRFEKDLAILSKNDSLFLYGIDGSSKYVFHDVVRYTSFKDGYVVQLKDAIYKYEVKTNSVEKICSIDEDYNVRITSQYVYTYDTGAKKGVHDYYSLVPGVESRLGLDDDENADMYLSAVGSYTIEVDEKTTISGTVYALTEQDPKDDEETITTYFNCYETITEAKKGLF